MTYTTLISVADLAAHIDDPEFVIFDCRHELTDATVGTRLYGESHLRNAHFAHVDKNLAAPLNGKNGRHPLPDPSVFIDWLGSVGVSNNKQVIGYDASGGVYASRVWWMLRWVGHTRVAVLNGGWQAWLAAGQTVTREVSSPNPAKFSGRADQSAVDASHVLKNLNSPAMRLIDARSNDRFRGQNETIDPVAGHIPGALNRFFKDNLDAQGLFKSAQELHAAFAPLLGHTPATQTVHLCGSGVSACHNLLAMEIVGMKGSRLYPGSWSEWITDPSRPIAT